MYPATKKMSAMQIPTPNNISVDMVSPSSIKVNFFFTIRSREKYISYHLMLIDPFGYIVESRTSTDGT